MKNNYLIFLLLLTLFSVSSCIQDEAPNAECDIVSVDAAWLEDYKEITNGKPIITNNLIQEFLFCQICKCIFSVIRLNIIKEIPLGGYSL